MQLEPQSIEHALVEISFRKKSKLNRPIITVSKRDTINMKCIPNVFLDESIHFLAFIWNNLAG